MQVILESVKIDLDEDEIRRLIDAVGSLGGVSALAATGRGEVPGVTHAAAENARQAIVRAGSPMVGESWEVYYSGNGF